MTSLTLNDLKILSSVISNDKYGLEIIADVKQAGTHLSLGSLYNALSRLEKEGLVESYWGEATAERGGNRRRYYKITAEGSKTVNEHQTTFNTLWNRSPAYSF